MLLMAGTDGGVGRFHALPDAIYVRSFLSPGLLTFCLLTLITTGPESRIFSLRQKSIWLFPARFCRATCCSIAWPAWVWGCSSPRSCFSLLLLQHVRYWQFGFFGICLAWRSFSSCQSRDVVDFNCRPARVRAGAGWRWASSVLIAVGAVQVASQTSRRQRDRICEAIQHNNHRQNFARTVRCVFADDHCRGNLSRLPGLGRSVAQ